MRDQNFDYCVKHYDPKISQKPKKQKLKKNPNQNQKPKTATTKNTPKKQVARIQQTNEYTVLKLYIALQFHMNHDFKSGPEKSIIHM